jgi:hypothetical protein
MKARLTGGTSPLGSELLANLSAAAVLSRALQLRGRTRRSVRPLDGRLAAQPNRDKE